MKKYKKIFGIVLCIMFSISTLATPFIVWEVELSQKGLILYRCLAFSIFFLFTLGTAISFDFITLKRNIAFVKGKFRLVKLWTLIMIMIFMSAALLMTQMPKSDKVNIEEHVKEEQQIKQKERLAAKEREVEKLKEMKEQEEKQKQEVKDAIEKKEKESIKQREKTDQKKKDNTIDLLYYNQVYKGDGKTISSKIVKKNIRSIMLYGQAM